MIFCVADTSYFESIGLNTAHMRKSLDGQKTLVHKEQLSDYSEVETFETKEEAFNYLLSEEFVHPRSVVGPRAYRVMSQDDLTEEDKEWFKDHTQAWEVDKSYGKHSVVRHNDEVYRCIQTHVSQEDWAPDKVPALFNPLPQMVAKDGTPVIPDWAQPTGAHNTYKKGYNVRFENKVYESEIDNNTWSPSEYAAGWRVVSSDEPDEPDVAEFKQPTGGHDAYSVGSRVLFDGKVYESVINGNVWSPAAHPGGWTLVT